MNSDEIEIKHYTDEIQTLFLQFLISDKDLFVRCLSIINPDDWNPGLRDTVKFMLEHTREHNVPPSLEQIRAVTNFTAKPLTNINKEHQDWFMRHFDDFCRHSALEDAVLQGVDFLKEKNYGAMEAAVKKASEVGLVTDLGTNYLADPQTRLQTMLERKPSISTGWKDIDYKLYGGLNRGEITIFCGGAGAGKSMFLQNLALNWLHADLNVAYISLELSEDSVSLRLDAMNTGMGTQDVTRDVAAASNIIKNTKTNGSLQIKQLPNNVTVNEIKSFLREYEIQNELKVDAVLVDYLDLLTPISKRISGDNLFIKDKYITEELRNLAVEKHILCVTASQLNRTSVEADALDHSHIAGGISKIQTADNVLGIYSTPQLRNAGKYQIQFLKTRSSSGVGSNVDLAFAPDTLRIVDWYDGQSVSGGGHSTPLLDKVIRKGMQPSHDGFNERTQKVRDFLNNR